MSKNRSAFPASRYASVLEFAAPDRDTAVRNFVNHSYSGWSLATIRTDLRLRLAEDRSAYDTLLRQLQVLYQNGLLDLGLTAEVHFEGTSNLVSPDLEFSRERLREIFRTLEEKQRLLDLLERFLEQSRNEVGVQIGHTPDAAAGGCR